MASEEDSSSSLTCKGTPVSELRVIDIKRELDERGLSKSGSKTQLTERLKAQLLLEKLQQDAAQSSGDELEGKAPNMALQDDKAGQNEFVRQYLQQQQRNIEIQLEVKKQVEEERKRKSADESSADESNRKKDASQAPAEPEVTSPKKFKDEQPNAPVKEVLRMPRASRKSSRHASKSENGQEAVRAKDHSRSSTPENESIRERTRSGSSSSDHSPTREKSRRGRRGRQPRGRSSRGARRGGRAVKESRSSSPSSSPDETRPKRKRRSTNSVSSPSPSRSPQLTAEVGARRSSRKTAAMSVPDQAPEAEAEDEKEKVRPQRKRWTRKPSAHEQPATKVDGKIVDLPSSDVANQDAKAEVAREGRVEKENEKASVEKEETTNKQTEEADVSKGDNVEKQTCVKIAEDNSGQKITSSPREKLELTVTETKLSESAAEEKARPKTDDNVLVQEENRHKAENPTDVAMPKVDDKPKAEGNKGVPEQNKPKKLEGGNPSDTTEAGISEEVAETNEDTKESRIRSESTSQELKAPTNRLSRWRSSRTKSHTPPQNDEVRAEEKMAPEAVKSTDSAGEQITSHTASEKSNTDDKSASLPVESGDAPSKEEEVTQMPTAETEQTHGEEEEKSARLDEKGPKEGQDSSFETKEKVDDDSQVKTTDLSTFSNLPKDKRKDEPSRGRQRTRSGSSSHSSSRSSSSGSKSDRDSKSSSSSSRSRSRSSSSSNDSRTKSMKAGAMKTTSKPEVPSQPPSDAQHGERRIDVAGKSEKSRTESQPSKSAPEPVLPAKTREKSPVKKAGSEKAGGEAQKKSPPADGTMDMMEGIKDSPVQTADAEDASKKDKLAKKRKWGSKTSKAARVVKKPANMEISSDSLKGLIGDVKLTETVFDMETEVVNTLDYDEQDDDRRDVKVKRTVVQSSPRVEEEEEGVENEDARLVETREDVPDEKTPSPAFVAEEPEKKIIKLSAAPPKEGKKKTKESKKAKVKVKKDVPSMPNNENKNKSEEAEAKEAAKEKIVALRRPSKPILQQVDDPEPVLEKLTSARFPTSRVLRIVGLVRPFTLNQLKELLKRTGEVEEELFWINSIKSECLVTYKSQEEAVETRKALHGTKWPSSNPKILDVDFSTLENVKHRQSGNTGPLPSSQRPKEEPLGRQPDRREEEERERRQKAREQREKEREERDKELKDKREAEKQKRREQERRTNIREWDRDKVQQMSRSRSRSKGRDDERNARRSRDGERERSERKRRERSREKDEEKKKDKKQKAEEEPPAKLLDDLFRKTKATPCVYWLPLTEEQAQQRLIQKEEREKERQKRLAAIEERNREEQKKREAARLERQRERQRERSGERAGDRARDGGRGKETSGKGRNRGRSSGSRSRSRSRSRRRR